MFYHASIHYICDTCIIVRMRTYAQSWYLVSMNSTRVGAFSHLCESNEVQLSETYGFYHLLNHVNFVERIALSVWVMWRWIKVSSTFLSNVWIPQLKMMICTDINNGAPNIETIHITHYCSFSFISLSHFPFIVVFFFTKFQNAI